MKTLMKIEKDTKYKMDDLIKQKEEKLNFILNNCEINNKITSFGYDFIKLNENEIEINRIYHFHIKRENNQLKMTFENVDLNTLLTNIPRMRIIINFIDECYYSFNYYMKNLNNI